MSPEATIALDLARRPDGFLTEEGSALDELLAAGLITYRYAGGGYVIAHAVHVQTYRYCRGWARAQAIGVVTA
jgi:hypothetical protein